MSLFVLTSVHADDSNTTNSTDSDSKKEMRMMMKEMMKEMMMMPEKCQGKHLNYAGTYRAKAATMSYDTTTSTLKGNEDQTFELVITPGSAGKTSWIMNWFTDPATRNVTNPTTIAQAEAGAGVKVDALCFAPPPKWGGKGMMSCVDTLDSGHTTIIPDEVNDDCEVVTASYKYTEAATVGCTETMCMPSIAHAELTRFTEE